VYFVASLIGCKAAGTVQALAPAPYGIPIPAFSGINDPVFYKSAKRALHKVSPMYDVMPQLLIY